MPRLQHAPRAAHTTCIMESPRENYDPLGRHGSRGYDPCGVQDLPVSLRDAAEGAKAGLGRDFASMFLRVRGRRHEAASVWVWAVWPPWKARGQTRVALDQTDAAHSMVQGDGGTTGETAQKGYPHLPPSQDRRGGGGARQRQLHLHSVIKKDRERLTPSGALQSRGHLVASSAP